MTRPAADGPHPPRPRPGLGLALIALAAGLMLAAPAGLVGWRLVDMRTGPAALDDAREDARALAAVARAIEGLRGLARQIRYAPAGAAGADARAAAAHRLRVLAADPSWRALAPPEVGTALDTARASLDRLVQRRGAREPWPLVIAERLAALDRFAAAPDDDSATPRARRLGALLAVLNNARRAGPAALPFLEREARRLAAEAIAAPGLPMGLDATTRLGSGASVHAAIADALDVPAARRAALTDRAGLDVLWRTTDGALAEAADSALAAADARLAAVHAGLDADRARLTAALLAALLAVVAVVLAVLILAAHGHAAPLGRLGRQAAALGFARRREAWGESVALAALDRALAASEADRARGNEAEHAAADARRDAETLASALLGAAAEAAAGRAAYGVADALEITLARVRRDAELARQEAAVLAPKDPAARPAATEARAVRAAHRIGATCAALDAALGEATRLVAALRPLNPTPQAPAQAPPPLAATLADTLMALAPRLQDARLHLSLSCPPDLESAADPGVLAAVLAYVIEAAALRAEAAPADADHAPAAPALAVDATPAEAGGIALSVRDDGPPPTQAVRTLLEGHPARDPARLAQALRTAPDAAALLLADGLARAGLGAPLTVAADSPGGLTVTLSLPRAAAQTGSPLSPG